MYEIYINCYLYNVLTLGLILDTSFRPSLDYPGMLCLKQNKHSGLLRIHAYKAMYIFFIPPILQIIK